MKTLYGIIVGALLCFILTCPALAEELKVTVNVENGEKATQVVGADIYAIIDNKLTEITVSPYDMPFKMNGKFGALKLQSFWLTKKQAGVNKD